MLYVEVTQFGQFCNAFPKSRQEAYSYEGLQALYEYWDRHSDEVGEDIEISEELDYPCCEYDSIQKAVNDYGDMDDIYWDMVNDYLMDKDIDIDDVDDWQQYIDELDEDEVTEKCVEFLEEHREIEYVEELDNGHVFIVKYE